MSNIPSFKTLLFDTHTWVWYLMGDAELKKSTRELMTEALHQNEAYISAISLWEISMLEKKKRIIIDMPCLSWINKFIELTHIQIAPISAEIAVDSCYLPEHFHPDPADRIITATARTMQLTLLTRDKRILNYGKQGLVSTIAV